MMEMWCSGWAAGVIAGALLMFCACYWDDKDEKPKR